MRGAVRVCLLAIVVVACVVARGAVAHGTAMPRAAPWELDVDRAMDEVGIAPGMVIGEAGAGDGYFTLPLARRVGPGGAVYANDIDTHALASLADHARRAHLANIHEVEGAVDDPRFPRRDLEAVVIVHAFHHFARPVEWLVNAKQYLGPGGVVAIIDLDPAQGASSHFWTRERILGDADRAGYDVVKLTDEISKHLIIVLRPRPPSAGPRA
jgi:ubiquinone/menaquinone biosynthesis C-methylase UbiE